MILQQDVGTVLSILRVVRDVPGVDEPVEEAQRMSLLSNQTRIGVG